MLIERIAARLKEIVDAVRERIEQVREHVHEEAERLDKKIDQRLEERLAERLDEIAVTTGATNWRNSAEDLAKVAGEDGSFRGRQQLWTDVGFEEKYTGSAEQNIKLHAAMWKALVDNYGVCLPDLP